jgi:uncharacterized repeat protein (TIGR02543 family)
MAFAALIGCSNPGGGDTTPSLVSISVEAAKHVYIQGQDLDLGTITVAGIYSDGSEKPIGITSGNIAGYDKTKAGNQNLTVTLEGKSAVFTVTVVTGADQAKEILEAALDAALETREAIVVSRDGSDVPQGIPWISPVQKEQLDEAIEAAREAAASGEAGLEEIIETLEALQKAEEEASAAAETQTGTKADWSYTVTFDINGGVGANPVAKTVASPDTTVDKLPDEPARSGYAFAGWNANADGSGSAFTEKTPLAANITVYAQWTLMVNVRSPVISSQPRSASYTEGDAAAALSVTAASPDDGTLSYRWHSRASSGDGWTALDGATESSYTPPTTAAGTFSYYVEVTNTNNNVNGTKTASANSAAATVTVSPVPIVNARSPVISSQPRSASYTEGDTAAALSVTAASPDNGTLSYQWHSRASSGDEWAALDGATESSCTPPTTAAGTFSYYVEVTNTNNDVNGTKTASANSAAATVTVNPAPIVNARPPVISVQPQSAAYTMGGAAAALFVTAASPDNGTLSYRWHSRAGNNGQWTAIDGATESSYTPPTAVAGTFSYYVEVTNTNNAVNGTKTASANSAAATVTVTVVDARSPVISVQPQSAAYTRNEQAAALSVTAVSGDGGTLSYQWHSSAEAGGEGTAISGATETSYTPATAVAGTIYYYVKVTNTNNDVNGTKTASTNSDAAAITVTLIGARAPIISAQPQDAAYALNEQATALSVTAASGDGGTLSYQWYSRVTAGTGTLIADATGPSYTPFTAARGIVYYYALITNTNNNVEGEKTAVTSSRAARVMTGVGAGNLAFAVWANDDRSLISNMPEDLGVSKAANESLVISAAEDLTGLQWSINGADLSAPRGTAQTISIEAAHYGVGTYTLGLRAKKDNTPYSINITFSVIN